jgi:putative ABC transport system ATP-binding protein
LPSLKDRVRPRIRVPEPVADAPVVEARGVTRTFEEGEQRVAALNGVDLRIARGEMVAIMGPSGCGKTTLLNCLSGLDAPTAGEVRIEGIDIFALDDRSRTRHRAARMGFVFQSYNLLPVLTAVENVEAPLTLLGVKDDEARVRALAALKDVGLDAKAHERASRLSGGQQQRVAVARAIAHRPAIVWGDEPTGNLDTRTALDVFALFRRLNQELGQTFVIVTHDPRIAAGCDRTVTMENGRVVD